MIDCQDCSVRSSRTPCKKKETKPLDELSVLEIRIEQKKNKNGGTIENYGGRGVFVLSRSHQAPYCPYSLSKANPPKQASVVFEN